MNELTKAQRVVLTTLADVARHEGGYIILKNQYHSAAAALIRRGYVVKLDRGFFRPGYMITPEGLRLYEAEVEPSEAVVA